MATSEEEGERVTKILGRKVQRKAELVELAFKEQLQITRPLIYMSHLCIRFNQQKDQRRHPERTAMMVS